MAFQRVAIVGTGLIGGSFALGVKKRGFGGEIVGCDRAEVLEKAWARGAIDRGVTEVAEALGDADLVYLATPVVTILDLLPEVAKAAKPGALVTDAGSTKVRVCKMAKEVLPESVAFLGGHPMAGRESGGIENADGDLFVGAKYLLIRKSEGAEEAKEAEEKTKAFTTEDTENTEKSVEKEFLEWIGKLGAEAVWLEAETHDWAVALVSQVPQLISTALASAVWDETDEDGLPLALAGAGFRDMARLAGSPYDVWRDICLTNSENLARGLERLEQRLGRMRERLRARELEEEFEKARQTYAWLKRGGKDE
jgi:prephenate dehydrogenase